VTQTAQQPETRPAAQAGLAVRDSRGILTDRLFKSLCVTAGVLVLAILGLILISTTNEAWPALRESGLSFITSDRWAPTDPDGTPEFGTLSLIYGTVVVSIIALVIAVPVSIGVALFLTELAPRRLRAPVVTVIDLLAAVPSVVFGLWGIIVVGPFLADVYNGIHGGVDGVPVLRSLFGESSATGRSFMTAGLIVAIMILPIVTSITREVFDTVPPGEKHAALALGATRWEMIRGAVFPHSFSGMVGAAMLGLGRALGETIAIALTIGAAARITGNVFATGEAMPAIIVRQFGESSGTFTSALIGIGVVLFIMTVLVNLAARFVVSRAEERMRGARA
jgi:phosphate transport system permease protein